MAEASPLVSVIISAYNAEAFIEETIDALFKQTYQNFEIIAVDDCSTDATGDILENYARRDSRVRVVHNAINEQAARSKNTGIDLARGKYIAINDADDISLPERLEKQVGFLEEHPDYSFVSCLVTCFYDDSNPGGKGAYGDAKSMEDMHFNYMSPDGDYEKTYTKIRKGMALTNRFCHSSMMGKAVVYKALKYKYVFAEDWELFNRAMFQGHKITKVPEVLLRYRIVHSGMCGVFSSQERPEMMKELHRLHQMVLQAARDAGDYGFIARFRYINNIRPRLAGTAKKVIHKSKRLVINILSTSVVRRSLRDLLLLMRHKLPAPALRALKSSINRAHKIAMARNSQIAGKALTKAINVLNNGAVETPGAAVEVIDGAMPCYNIGVWTIEEKWMMGGLHTILQMAVAILKSGQRVRFINYGLQNDFLVEGFYRSLREHFDLTDAQIEMIEVVYFITFKEQYQTCHADDRFIAGFWFPAEDIQKINKKSDHFNRKKYVYIIQDYEPHMLYRWGSDYVRSYNTFLDKNYYPLFNNSEFVCGYVKKLGLIDNWQPYQVLSGEPCKTEPPPPEKMEKLNARIRLLFYSRPSVDKNIYDIKIEAIKLFIDALETRNPGILKSLIVTGIGETAPSQSYKGVLINNLGKLSYKEYPAFIQNYNIGLACIISPAFAYPCLEFPRAGLVTVVNRFETRDLQRFSENIISCDASAESICEKLLEAVDKIKDVETRQKAAKFELPGVGIQEATARLMEFLERQA